MEEGKREKKFKKENNKLLFHEDIRSSGMTQCRHRTFQPIISIVTCFIGKGEAFIGW